MNTYKNAFGETVEMLDEFDPYGTDERDELLDYIELVESAALAELREFGCVEFEVATSDAELNEDECEPFWAFACDLYDEPRPYVPLDLF